MLEEYNNSLQKKVEELREEMVLADPTSEK
jgi:hypothetical protein